MTKREKLLEKAENNPRGVRFEDLETLVKSYGFTLARQSGSHKQYQVGRWRLTLQSGKDGKAKEYQVLQALAAIAQINTEGEE